MDIAALRDHLHTVVRLSFADGEEVEALLIDVDLDDHQDLIYELRRVIRPGNPPPVGSSVGATLVAPLAELTAWQSV